MLELRHLRTLTALAETGSLSVAAERVHLTQSALSHQLKSLEKHYGASLFQRKSNPLRLSPAGQRLLDLASETLAAVDNAERDLLRMADAGDGRFPPSLAGGRGGSRRGFSQRPLQAAARGQGRPRDRFAGCPRPQLEGVAAIPLRDPRGAAARAPSAGAAPPSGR